MRERLNFRFDALNIFELVEITIEGSNESLKLGGCSGKISVREVNSTVMAAL